MVQLEKQSLSLASISAKLKAIAAEVRNVVIEREQLINVVLVALIAQQHVLLLGKPGRGKTQLANELAKRITGLNEFNLLLNKFLPPEELFGPVAISQLMNDNYVRATAGFLPEAHLAVLDEVGKCNVASLNLLLGAMSDRVFTNGSQVMRIPLMSIIGTSNEIPNGDDLAALYDRFLIRYEVKALSAVGRKQMFAARNPGGQAAKQPVSHTISLEELQWVQGQLDQVEVPDAIIAAVMDIHDSLGAQGIEASDRRTAAAKDLLCASALLNDRTYVTEDDLEVLMHVYWDRPDDQAIVRKAVNKFANPLKTRATEVLDAAQDKFESVMALLTAENNGSNQIKGGEVTAEIGKSVAELKRAIQFNAASPAVPYLEEVVNQLLDMNDRLFSKMTGRS